MIYDVNSPLFRSFLSQKGGSSDKRFVFSLFPSVNRVCILKFSSFVICLWFCGLPIFLFVRSCAFLMLGVMFTVFIFLPVIRWMVFVFVFSLGQELKILVLLKRIGGMMLFFLEFGIWHNGFFNYIFVFSFCVFPMLLHTCP